MYNIDWKTDSNQWGSNQNFQGGFKCSSRASLGFSFFHMLQTDPCINFTSSFCSGFFCVNQTKYATCAFIIILFVCMQHFPHTDVDPQTNHLLLLHLLWKSWRRQAKICIKYNKQFIFNLSCFAYFEYTYVIYFIEKIIFDIWSNFLVRTL